MAVPPKTALPPKEGLLPRVFAVCFGAFFGLCLLKFGNPPIFEQYVAPPTNGWEFVFNQPWPIAWAYWMLAVVAVVGVRLVRWRWPVPWWLTALPLAWCLWECLAASHSVRPDLTRGTLEHFAACVVCFYLGLFCLSRVRRLTGFWVALLVGFLLMLASGWEQHFGGLEDTRRYVYTHMYDQLTRMPPEYLKKLQSTRIFATLFYANTLAGALLLLLLPLLACLGGLRRQFSPGARAFVVAVVAVGGLGCLFWSGSKGGWLLMLLLGLLALLRLRFSRRLKLALVVVILAGGLAGFFVKYAAFFHKGAPSVGARFDYWRAAAQITAENPVFGTGPGTFAVPYARVKRPEAEMARLTHNDYLQQACDSGLPAFLLYTGFIAAALVVAYRKLDSADWQAFAIWLGVFGLALQSLFEFSLYVPALAWPFFGLLGFLVAHKSEGANRPSAASLPGKQAAAA